MGKKRPLVSVLVPVYNVEKYLEPCLDSLVSQTLKDIEIVCVNDGSTDSSLKILNNYADIDDRIVIVNKQNGGLPSARNAGLDVAKGLYVGFVDGDDYVASNMFEKMYEAARKSNADIVVCGARILPDETIAPQWLKDVLSTRDIVYSKADVDILVKERGAHPFLWRNLVRKNLIDKYNFRLEETVIVGEDLAFQFKLFAVAKVVKFISDKLYNYRYNRPDSIMSSELDYGNRLLKHVFMIENIIDSWKKLGIYDDKRVMFLNWAIDFIYWDIIKVSACDKVEIAEKFCRLMIDSGYYLSVKQVSESTRRHFKYISGICGKHYEKPETTIVAVFEGGDRYLYDFICSLTEQTEKNLEILLYDNNADESAHNVVRDFLYKDDRICLRMGGWQPVSEKYNDAIRTAKGKYIAFINPYDYFNRNDWLEKSLKAFADTEIGLVGYKNGLSGKADINSCCCADYHNFVYRLEHIQKNNIYFEDYSFYTGKIFFTRYCLKCEYAYFTDKYLMRSKSFKRTSIYADEAKLILKAMVWLLETAEENNLSDLAEKIGDNLNSENYVRLITDSTYGFNIDSNVQDSGKNDYHTEVFSLLIRANDLVHYSGTDRAVSRTLAEFVLKRHLWLENIYRKNHGRK